MVIRILCAFWTWGEQELMLALSEMSLQNINHKTVAPQEQEEHCSTPAMK